MDFFSAMEVSASGLSAQRVRMNVASSNLANVNTTSTASGGAYQRLNVVLASKPLEGAAGANSAVQAVEVKQIAPDGAPSQLEYDPGHPDANADGYVEYPAINAIEEMVDMITASRAYEAGISALSTAVSLAERAIGIGRG